YNKFNPERLAKINQIYNHVKAYFTLKNFSTKKIRLNFGIESFLETWDIDQIDENLGTILLKKEAGKTKYFLGIVNRKNFSKFEYLDDKVEDKSKTYRQMICKYVSASKNEGQTHKIEFKYITQKSIDDMVEKEELYLFQIYRNDFSNYSKGSLKLHTMYWNNIFDEDNVGKDNIFSISGEARIFYRAKSLENVKVTHKANEPIKNKNVNNPKKESTFKFDLIKDKRYTENKLMFHVPISINCNAKEMTLKEFNNIINKRIQDIQNKAKKDRNQEAIKIIAVTRAEKELLYYVVMNSKLNDKGEYEILEQGALNQIKSKANNQETTIVLTDYKEKYETKNKELTIANEANNSKDDKDNNDENIIKEWKSERSIKDFLDGYISQAVNEIVKLVRKYNAIVVFEDLKVKSEKMNSIIGKSLYYKLEKALIAKLSYLADKHIGDEDKSVSKFKEGSTFNAYQLAYYDEEKISDEKQNGIVFYVPANLTTNIDPKSRFMNCFSNKLSDASVDVKDFVSKFNSIVYNEEKQYYEFDFEYRKFLVGRESKKSDEFTFLNKLYKFASRDNWTICSYGDRIEKTKQKDPKTRKFIDKYDKVNLTENFKKLFEKYKIRQSRGLQQNIKNFLDNSDNSSSAQLKGKGMGRLLNNRPSNPKEEFSKEFIRLFKLMVQMKNSDGKSTYVISPVEKDGVFYDSRKVTEFSNDQQSSSIDSVVDSDSPCRAYNIAKKGLMILDKIKEAKDEDKLYNIDLTLNDEDWINYVDNKPIG
ncbi:type V CRISPR-associated protein Cas12a/Cpf1, partial [bacterium]|nr:type V CRISPR-associated protein Cas12a/Cpf1 [bacterium]